MDFTFCKRGERKHAELSGHAPKFYEAADRDTGNQECGVKIK
jgi:hypothetical protein